MDAMIVAGIAAATAALGIGAGYALARHRAVPVTDETMSADAPVGVLQLGATGSWAVNAKAATLLGLDLDHPVSTESLIACADANTRATLSRGLEILVDGGDGFEMSIEAAGRTLKVIGRTGVSAPVLWVQDESSAAWLAQELAQRDIKASVLEAVLDTIPHPVWWRDAQALSVIGANAPYRLLFGDPDKPTAESQRIKDLAQLARRTGVSQTESRALVIGGLRRSFDFSETPLSAAPGYIAGVATDVTALEEMQSTLAEHIAVQDQVLERLTAAIAIFGPDKRIKFFNKPYADMFRLSVDFLEDQPTLSTLMETLRQKRQLPETSDFPAYKRDWEAMFTDLLEPTEFLLHVPDGRTLRAKVSPHPLGGLIFQFDDVTDRLALESTRQTLIAVQRSTLNAVFEGVCAFGRDGRLKLFNDAFVTLFGLDAEWLATEPHVNEVADATQTKLRAAEDVHGTRDRYVMTVLEPTKQSGRLHTLDDRIIEYAFVPLPDGQCLVLYLDITDSTQVEAALKDRNRALENADLLKSRFISSMSYELRTPLNAIMGFAELLKLQAVGPLEERQQSYVNDILHAARFLADLIGDLLDLAALQAGYLEFEKQRTEFDPLMEEAIRTAIEWLSADPARVDWSPSSDMPMVQADPRRLHQAMRHLVVDALHYADTMAPILVASGQSSEGGAWLRVTVPQPDTSMRGWADHVLEPTGGATQADDRAPGADVGLSLFRALVSAHNATITADEDRNAILCRFPPDAVLQAAE